MPNIEELIRQKENIERKLREANVKHIIENNVAITRGELCGSVQWTMTIHSKQNRNRHSKVITAFNDAEFFEEVKELQNNIAKAVERAESEDKE